MPTMLTDEPRSTWQTLLPWHPSTARLAPWLTAASLLMCIGSSPALAQSVPGSDDVPSSTASREDSTATRASQERADQPVPTPVRSVLDELSDAARDELERLCLPVQFRSGAAAYRDCVSEQLARLNNDDTVSDERPSLSFDEQYAIQQACGSNGNGDSQAYRRCESQQYAELRGSQPAPLSYLSDDEQYAVQQGCFTAQTRQGVRAYRDCLNASVSQLLVLPRPNLSSLSLLERNALQMRCSDQAGTAIDYRECLIGTAGSLPALTAEVDDTFIAVDTPRATTPSPGVPDNDLAANELSLLSDPPTSVDIDSPGASGSTNTPAASPDLAAEPSTVASGTAPSPATAPEAAPAPAASDTVSIPADDSLAPLDASSSETSTEQPALLSGNGSSTGDAESTLALGPSAEALSEPALGSANDVDESGATTHSTRTDNASAIEPTPTEPLSSSTSVNEDALIDDPVYDEEQSEGVEGMLARVQRSFDSLDNTNRMIMVAAAALPLLLILFWLLMRGRERDTTPGYSAARPAPRREFPEEIDLSSPRRPAASPPSRRSTAQASESRQASVDAAEPTASTASDVIDERTRRRLDQQARALFSEQAEQAEQADDRTVVRPLQQRRRSMPAQQPVGTRDSAPTPSLDDDWRASTDWPPAANEDDETRLAPLRPRHRTDESFNESFDASLDESRDGTSEDAPGVSPQDENSRTAESPADTGLAASLREGPSAPASSTTEEVSTPLHPARHPETPSGGTDINNAVSEVPAENADRAEHAAHDEQTGTAENPGSAGSRSSPISSPPARDDEPPATRTITLDAVDAVDAPFPSLDKDSTQEPYLAWLSVQDEQRQMSLAIEFLIYWMAYADERYAPSLRQKIMQMKSPSDIDRIKRWSLLQDVHAFAANLHWLQHHLDAQQKEQTLRLLMALLVNENALTPSQNTLLRFLADAFGVGLEHLAELYLNAFGQMLPDMPRPDKPAWWQQQPADSLKRWDGRSVSRQSEDIQHRVRLGLPLGVELEETEILDCYQRAVSRCDPESYDRLPARTRSLAMNQLNRYEMAAQSLLEVCA